MKAGKRATRFELYRDKRGDWRWRVVAANGRVLADSGEGYSRRCDALRGAERTAYALPGGEGYKG